MTYTSRHMTHPLEPWDASALFALTSDVRVTKYLGFKTHTKTWEALQLIEGYKKNSGQWLGVYRDHKPDEDRGPLLGVYGIELQGHAVAMAIYFSHEAPGTGRRFSTYAVHTLFRLRPNVKRVFAHCHVDNIPVQRVLERMGATREGRMRNYAVFPNISPEPADCYLYSLLPGELRELT